ncbi:hypothetical protein [Alicyclobacillus macrosporangiidus]|uniref:hypothetical protein n=1 Tax=Alicyclobacillus macrosporangiidus TaxID=392015 RepID=UPI00054DBC9C|nr:hypothetical protein [Alicyclobacillus macrosporangiidus]
MERTSQLVGNLVKKEDALFPFAFLTWFAYHYDPAILKPFQISLISVVHISSLTTWISIAVALISAWNKLATIMTSLWLIWRILMVLIPSWQERAEQNWSRSTRVSLGWFLRSSLWWWNLYAFQILLSIPVAHVATYPKLLVYPYPIFALILLVAWIAGATENEPKNITANIVIKSANIVIQNDNGQMNNERKEKYRQPLSSRFVSHTKTTDDNR